jgi:hypothetical protein
MGDLAKMAPKIDWDDLTQTAALPLGSWLKVDPWDDTVHMLDAKRYAPMNARDKMPFEVTPIFFKLQRYESAQAAPAAVNPAANQPSATPTASVSTPPAVAPPAGSPPPATQDNSGQPATPPATSDAGGQPATPPAQPQAADQANTQTQPAPAPQNPQ